MFDAFISQFAVKLFNYTKAVYLFILQFSSNSQVMLSPKINVYRS